MCGHEAADQGFRGRALEGGHFWESLQPALREHAFKLLGAEAVEGADRDRFMQSCAQPVMPS